MLLFVVYVNIGLMIVLGVLRELFVIITCLCFFYGRGENKVCLSAHKNKNNIKNQKETKKCRQCRRIYRQ